MILTPTRSPPLFVALGTPPALATAPPAGLISRFVEAGAEAARVALVEEQPFSVVSIQTNRPDPDGGVPVTMRNSRTGIVMEVVGASGATREMTEKEAASELFANMPQTKTADGTVMVTMQEGPINDRMAWVKNPLSANQLQLRVFPPTLKDSRARLQKIQAEQLAKIAAREQHFDQGRQERDERMRRLMNFGRPLPGQSPGWNVPDNHPRPDLREIRNQRIEQLIKTGRISPDIAAEMQHRPGP